MLSVWPTSGQPSSPGICAGRLDRLDLSDRNVGHLCFSLTQDITDRPAACPPGQPAADALAPPTPHCDLPSAGCFRSVPPARADAVDERGEPGEIAHCERAVAGEAVLGGDGHEE